MFSSSSIFVQAVWRLAVLHWTWPACRVSRVMQGFPPESSAVTPEPNREVIGYLTHPSTFSLQLWLLRSDSLRQPAEDLWWSPSSGGQPGRPGSILVKTHSSYKRASPPVQQGWADYQSSQCSEEGFQAALKYRGYLSFLPRLLLFLLTSWLKEYVRVGQRTWEEMRMCAPSSSVCPF